MNVRVSRRLNIPYGENLAGRTVSQGSAGKRMPSQPWAVAWVVVIKRRVLNGAMLFEYQILPVRDRTRTEHAG